MSFVCAAEKNNDILIAFSCAYHLMSVTVQVCPFLLRVFPLVGPSTSLLSLKI